MVVVAAQAKPKTGGYELQLPSMASLTSKTSSQAFFLRILKVILQLRDAARLAAAKAKRKQSETAAPTASIATTTGASSSSTASAVAISSSVVTGESMLEGAAATAAPISATVSTVAPTEDTEVPAPMEVDDVGNSKDFELPRLSQQLILDSLWNTLSECLQELADTPDHHAVLVLQPAVEAFFLVHAAQTSKEEREKRSRRQETRESQLSHLQQEIGGPGSPNLASGQANADDSINLMTVSMTSSSALDLPPDTQKFLTFAERHRTVLNQVIAFFNIVFLSTLNLIFYFRLNRFFANQLRIWPMDHLLYWWITRVCWTLTSSVAISVQN